MAYKINWTENALEDYYKIITYLLVHFNDKIAKDFVSNVEKRLTVLSIHPFIGIRSEVDNDVRSILLSRYNRMYYMMQENVIVILDIFDLRQDDQKNKY